MNTSARYPQASPLDTLRAVTDQRLLVGAHVVDLGSLRVTSGIDQPKLTPKAASVLLELARRAGHTVTHDELLDRVWVGTCPTRNVLTQAIKELRRALDGHDPDSCIRTIPKIGYRLVVPAVLEDSASPTSCAGRPDRAPVAGPPSPPATRMDAQQAVVRDGVHAVLRDYVPMLAVALMALLILLMGVRYFA